MPIYRFRCDDCDQQVELIQRMDEKAPPEKCEHCGGKSFRDVIGAPMYVLKGPGWANDGYHYVKTPADDIKGYSDDRRQTILPNKPERVQEAVTLPDVEAPVTGPVTVSSDDE